MTNVLRAALLVSALSAIGPATFAATTSATVKSDSNGTSGTKISLTTTGSTTFTIGTTASPAQPGR